MPGETHDGNPDDGESHSGNPDDGNPDDGESHGGNPDDGDPDGGESHGGNPDGGNPDGGDPHDGNPDDGDPDDGNAGDRVLADLRRARRRRRIADFDPFEALYRAYITLIVGGIAVWLLSGVTGDRRVGAGTAARAASHGPAVVGAAIALAVAIGVRSGGKGGPLAIEAADVRHVLMAPVDRTAALRGPAVRQLRFGVVVGTGVGAVAGLLAYRRLPGSAPAWIACGAAVGALGAAGSLGAALATSGRRLGRVVAGLVACAVVAWSAADVAAGTATSPATFLGQVALWPLEVRLTGLIGVAVLAAVVVAGLASVGGTSIEAAERRASLVGQIRFAATLRDLRTVMVLRRQLSQELPRRRPWLRLPRSVPLAWLEGSGVLPQAGAETLAPRAFPVWRRGWHGILRFPAARLVRLAVLGGLAGAAALGAERGTTPLVVAAGAALYVAALDAAEPLSQELDHPDRRDGLPVDTGVLMLRQLAPPLVVMVVVSAVGWAVVAAVTGGDLRAVEIGAILIVPAAAGGLAGAAVSIVQGAPPPFQASNAMLPPEAVGARTAVRLVWPPILATVGVLPVLAARHPPAGGPVAAVGSVAVPVLILMGLVVVWVRYRDRIHASFRAALADARQGSPSRVR
ncbi:MAG TPA: hypothetical protein VG184_04130 [Acidimicrobiales bacterium]|nr:hypothetical protein [Acidimicrobiales bacterium]